MSRHSRDEAQVKGDRQIELETVTVWEKDHGIELSSVAKTAKAAGDSQRIGRVRGQRMGSDQEEPSGWGILASKA